MTRTLYEDFCRIWSFGGRRGTCDDAADVPVPGQTYTFGIVESAQARGDSQVLAERRRRALRVHLGADVAAGLRIIRAAMEQALP